MGEIAPQVATPLSTTITTGAFRQAFGELLGETGAFRRRELDEPSATGGVFGGYLYFNVSFARVFARRVPGLRPSDIDQQMMGSGALPPPVPRRGDRNLALSARALVTLGVTAVRRRRPDLGAQRAETSRWLAALPDDPSDDDVVDLARSYTPRLVRNLRSLLDAGLGAGFPMSLLERLATRYAPEEPGLVVRALSGLGTIETARPAAALWDLGRQVTRSETLTAAFDDGVPGLPERLAEVARSDPEGSAFLASFDAFLAEHGHRGPNEVELASTTWATDPEAALAVVERLRLGSTETGPREVAARLTSEQADARRRLREAVPSPLRRLCDRLIRSAARGAARREEAKGTLVLDLHGLRRALHGLAGRLVSEGALQDRMSLFMVTTDELGDFIRSPGAFAGKVDARRRRYDELNALVPPFWFEGQIPDPSTWPARDTAPEGSVRVGDELPGIGVAAGTAEGPARIVVDPADPRGILPGDVLVAPITDPAWTPLFLAAAAVVVEVGALQSHAAIVARELGLPAVVSVEGATTRLRDGDHLVVDGDRGSVRLVARD